jgi:2-amino-4-hydroxy-6-hydroxymethyldihydropteridine diphosphokinase
MVGGQLSRLFLLGMEARVGVGYGWGMRICEVAGWDVVKGDGEGMPGPLRAGFGLGSNLGDRGARLCEALEGLVGWSYPGAKVVAASRVYETEPVDCPPGSGWYLNCVVELELPVWLRLLGARAILGRALLLEERMGRPAARSAERGYHEPRAIDIDLLYVGGLRESGGGLELPHPRMGERQFVRVPLGEIR